MNDTENLEKSNDLNTDNNEAISNLIQNIQSKLNGEINNTKENCNIEILILIILLKTNQILISEKF